MICDKVRDPLGSEIEHAVELFSVKRLTLSGPLHFDDLPRTRHHHVGVDVRRDILGVLEVEESVFADQTDGDRGDMVGER